EKLLEDLGAGADHHVLRADGNAEFFLVIPGDGLAERGQSQGCAVVGGAVGDGPEACLAGVPGGGKRAVADLQLDDVLGLGLEPFGQGQDVERGFGGQAAGEGAEGEGRGWGAHHQLPVASCQLPVPITAYSTGNWRLATTAWPRWFGPGAGPPRE